MSIPYEPVVDGRRLVIVPDSMSTSSPVGAYLTGPQAQAAVDKARGIVASDLDAWPAAPDVAIDMLGIDGLVDESQWSGPLVVSMPRTGSTLLGILFLFSRDLGPGGRDATFPDGHRTGSIESSVSTEDPPSLDDQIEWLSILEIGEPAILTRPCTKNFYTWQDRVDCLQESISLRNK